MRKGKKTNTKDLKMVKAWIEAGYTNRHMSILSKTSMPTIARWTRLCREEGIIKPRKRGRKPLNYYLVRPSSQED